MSRPDVAIWLRPIPLILAVMVVGGCGWDSESESEATPEAAEPPAIVPAQGRSADAYLEGAGAPLLVMHETASSLPETPTVAECQAAAAKLDTEVPSAQALRLARAIEDEPLQTAFAAERNALGVLLSECTQAGATEANLSDQSEDLAIAKAAVEERLAEVRATT